MFGRYTVEELPHSWILVCAYFVFGAHCKQLSIEKHRDAVGDSEGAVHLMRNNKSRNLKSLLQKYDQFIEFRRDNRIKTSGRLIENKDLGI